MNTSDEPLLKKTKRSSDIVHVIAPGQTKKLSYWLTEENYDINAFPDLFPDGKGGLEDKSRKRKISPVQNYSQKMLNHDPRFAQDEDFLFVAQQSLEKQAFENQISVSVQRGIAVKVDGKVQIKGQNAIDVFKDIPGTPAYFKKYRNELFARMEQLGPFHFFLTLSSAEMKWPEVTANILHTLGHKIFYENGWEEDDSKIKIDNIPLPAYKEKYIRNKSSFFKKQFFLITRMFDDRVKAFIKLLLADGKVNYYSYRIEFQLRGMPHLHGVFWLNKKEIEACIDEGGEYKDREITELIDKWVSCSLDTGNEKLNALVKEVNVHGHTPSCEKGKQHGCRFHFPRFPSKKTLIAHPPSSEMTQERISELEAILKKVKEKLEDMKEEEILEDYQNDLDVFLHKLEINIEDYEAALSTSQKGKIVVLKRTLLEKDVNNYNKEFLWAWRANMDIQFCYDSYAVVTYLTDYLTKTDAGLTRAMKKALDESKGCNDLDRLNYVKRAYFTNKQASVAEATYRLTPGMNLKKSNVKSRFVATGYHENRYNFYHKINTDNSNSDHESDTETEDEDDDEEDEEEEKDFMEETNFKGITLPGRQGKFRKSVTVHKKYANRPDELENICMAQFATSFESCKKPKKAVFDDDGVSEEKGGLKIFGCEKPLPKSIQLKSGGYMSLRKFPSILRIHSSKKKKDENEGLYSELLLFLPWRSEVRLRKDCIQKFDANYDLVERNRKTIYPFSKMIDVAREILQNQEDDGRATHLLEGIDANGQQENLDNEDIQEPMDTSVLPEEEPAPKNIKSDGCLFKPIVVDEDEYMLERVRSLSFEQRIVFDKFVKFTKSVLRNLKGASIVPIPPNIIVTGNVYKNAISIQPFLYSIIFTYYRRWRSRKKLFNHYIS